MNTILELFTSPQSLPFAVALAVVAGLFVIELLSAMLGSSLLGVGTDGVDADLDADFDLSAEFEAGLDATEIELDFDASSLDAAPSGLLTWIGARDVPFLIWLVSFLTLFGLAGLILQSSMMSVAGFPLPVLLASVAAAVPALAITRVIANWVALLMPKSVTTATRARHLGGRHGTITQGTAARGKPAEVKIKDRHDNIHYLRVEPLHDDDVFPQGSFVTLIRKRGDKFYII